MHIVVSLVLLALVFLAYHRALGSLGTWWLFLLRLLQAGVLFLVLTGRTFTVVCNRSSNRVVVLRDRSASVAAAGADSIADGVVSQLSSLRPFSQEVWEFAGVVRRGLASKGEIDTGRTDIGLALATAAKASPGAIVLVTDGQSNTGDDPVATARDAGIPVYAIGLGDERRENMRLVNMDFPPVVYLGETVTVRVRLASSSVSPARVRVRLNGQTAVVQRDSGVTEQDVEFHLRLASPGIHKLEAIVDSVPGEASYSDNHIAGFLDVRPAKVRVSYLTNRPGLNSRFLLSLLRLEGRIELLQFVGTGAAFRTSDLKNADVYILDAITENEEMQGFLRLVERRVQQGAGVLIVAGPGFEPGEVTRRILSLGSGVDIDSGTFSPVATAAGRLLPWLDLDGGVDLSTVPPFHKVWTGRFDSGRHELWLEAAEKQTPLFLLARYGRGKTVYVAGYPLWRWGYGPEMRLDESSPLGKLVKGILQFMAYADTAMFRVQTDKELYSAGEPIRVLFTARSADGSGWEGLVPYVSFDSHGSRVPMTELGQGRYEAVLHSSPGPRIATVTATVGDTVLGVAKVQFAVSDQSLEYSRTGLNAGLLRRVAAVSGGQFVKAESLHVERLDIRPSRFRQTLSLDMRQTLWVYLAFALFAATELTLRRIGGLL
ncbi:MAG: hypothetical protein ABIK43_02235 [candidate division WOR-3 bacterium]